MCIAFCLPLTFFLSIQQRTLADCAKLVNDGLKNGNSRQPDVEVEHEASDQPTPILAGLLDDIFDPSSKVEEIIPRKIQVGHCISVMITFLSSRKFRKIYLSDSFCQLHSEDPSLESIIHASILLNDLTRFSGTWLFGTGTWSIAKQKWPFHERRIIEILATKWRWYVYICFKWNIFIFILFIIITFQFLTISSIYLSSKSLGYW